MPKKGTTVMVGLEVLNMKATSYPFTAFNQWASDTFLSRDHNYLNNEPNKFITACHTSVYQNVLIRGWNTQKLHQRCDQFLLMMGTASYKI